MEVLVFAVPLLIIAWILWVKPKTGAVILAVVGVILLGLMLVTVNFQNLIDSYFVGPILLGILQYF